jgi:hypothetical protein
MDRSALDALDAGTELAIESRCDFSSGFVGEGEDTNAGGIKTAAFDQESDALDEAVGLPRSRAGTHEEWLRLRLDSRSLRSGSQARRGTNRRGTDSG